MHKFIMFFDHRLGRYKNFRRGWHIWLLYIDLLTYGQNEETAAACYL